MISLGLFGPDKRRMRLRGDFISLQLLTRSGRSVLMTGTGPKRMAWSYFRGGSGWVLGKGSSPEGSGHGTDSPGCCTKHSRLQESFEQNSQKYGLIFGVVLCGARSWTGWSFWSLPILDILFCSFTCTLLVVECSNLNPMMEVPLEVVGIACSEGFIGWTIKMWDRPNNLHCCLQETMVGLLTTVLSQATKFNAIYVRTRKKMLTDN